MISPPLIPTAHSEQNSCQTATEVDEPRRAPVDFPIIGIGASAGGLEAFEEFFRACPADSGMAYVLVPHLDPDHHSLLTEILQRCTRMPVAQAVDAVAVEPDHIYIIPPNREMALLNGALILSEPGQARGQRLPIDVFFQSLAQDRANRAIGIVLSGTASDGTRGLAAILAAGGICMVQEPTTAKYDGMPQSAIHAGVATHVLPPQQMPAVLRELARQTVYRQQVAPLLPTTLLNGLSPIFLQLRTATGHDFSLYKKSTIGRRVERRMLQHDISDVAVYARFLKDNPLEIHALFKELLINVTSFCRDAEAFATLKQDILTPMLADKPDDYEFRAWVAGCASGEEAYSIAILLREIMKEQNRDFKVQIYATDLDEESINLARTGSYSANITQDLTPERLSRFFTKTDTGYKVKKEIREMVVFAVQSVIKDPPFTKLDLLCCRNLMIYLEPSQQNLLIPIFQYALKPGGVLFLSSSESITGHTELFHPLNRKWKIYQAIHAESRPSATRFTSPTMTTNSPLQSPMKPVATTIPARDSLAALSDRVLLAAYAPASVTTNGKGDILYLHGDTSRYLRSPSGPITTNVIEMAHEDLQFELRAALAAAVKGVPTLNREVTFTVADSLLRVSLSVRPLPPVSRHGDAGRDLLLVSFQELVQPPQPVVKPRRGKVGAGSAEQSQIEKLERELAYAKENLQATTEEHQVTNEELKSTNEELQSTNEELQSSNEELETSKEELQSLNEETITVNSELSSKVEQLITVQNDMKNLLDAVNIGTLFLDYHLTIRRYTRDAVKAYRLIPSDVGRPLSDITSNLEGKDLADDLRTVLETLIPCDREVRAMDGTWYLVRMQPYRTLDNMISGVVITFTDISALREAAQVKLQVARLAVDVAQGIVDTVVEPLVLLDGSLNVVSASRAFYQHFQVTPEQTVSRKIYDLGDRQWDIPALRELLEKVLPEHSVMEGFVVAHDFPALGPVRIVLNARRLVSALGSPDLILLAMDLNDGDTKNAS
jgi:two-component system CheB/CheR fusion protein